MWPELPYAPSSVAIAHAELHSEESGTSPKLEFFKLI